MRKKRSSNGSEAVPVKPGTDIPSTVQGEDDSPLAAAPRTGRSPVDADASGFRASFTALSMSEKDFVREALKDADYERAARVAGHKRPYDLLRRSAVRSVLLQAAPYSASLAAKLAKPFVMQALLDSALKGDAQSVKLMLSLASETKASPRAKYSDASPGIGDARAARLATLAKRAKELARSVALAPERAREAPSLSESSEADETPQEGASGALWS